MISQTPEFGSRENFSQHLGKDLPFSSVDRAFNELFALAETVAKSKASILIVGESGSGKRTLAKYVHSKSTRATLPCALISCRDLINESDINFEKRLIEANGSTVVLAEISKLSFRLQGVLLSSLARGLDLRLIATSSRSLSQLVKNGEFKEELYLKLNVVNLKVPQLSERLGDVENLAKVFVKEFSEQHSRETITLSDEAILLLNSYAWPGNVKELQNVCERAVLLVQGTIIRSRDIQFQQQTETILEVGVQTLWKPGKTLDEIERTVILEALRHFNGNRTHASKALGISIRTLRNKLAEYRVIGIKA